MSLPIQLTKRLSARPPLPGDQTPTILSFAVRPHAEDWLRIHGESFLGGRAPWPESRFRRELLDRPWFSPQQMWWAMSAEDDRAIGTITLEVDGDAGQIHWLMVEPAARRSGVASALLQTLENGAWEAGVRQLSAETLSNWAPAVAFYRRHGYQAPPIADRAKSR